MKSIQDIHQTVVNDTILTEEDATMIKEAVVETAKASLNIREAIPVNPINEGTQIWEARKVDSDSETEAELVSKGSDYPMVSMEKTPQTYNVFKIGVGFELFREDILSARMHNQDLPTQSARMAARLVAEKENNLLLNGDTIVDGLLAEAHATNTSNATDDWITDSFTAQEVQDDIIDTLDELGKGLYGGPVNLILSKSRFNYLQRIDSNVDRNFFSILSDTANIQNIYWDPDMPDSKALAVVSRPEVLEYGLAEDLNTVPIEDGDDEVQEFKVRVRGALAVYQNEGLVELDGI